MPGEAKVADICALAVGPNVDENVAGLHVAMDESCRVRRVEGLGYLSDKRNRALSVQPAFAPEQFAEVRPL